MKLILAVTIVMGCFAGSAAGAQTTICQATQGGYGTYCSDSAPSTTASGGYNNLPSWVNIQKTLTQITVADNQVWGVDANNVLWELPNFKAATLTWVQVATGVAQISAQHNLLCQIGTNAHTLCTSVLTPAATANSSGNHTLTWTDTGATTYTQIAASAGNQFWAVDVNHNLWQVPDYTNLAKTAVMVAAGIGLVAVDGRGLLCETDTSYNVYCNSWPVPPAGPSGSYHSLAGWVALNIQLKTLAVADGKVLGTDTSGTVNLLPDYTNSATWEKIAYGGAGDVMAGASAPSTWTPTAFASDEVAVMVFMGQSNSTGINSVPARYIAPSSPNVWGVTNGGWNFLTGNANGTAPFAGSVSTINAITWSHWQVQANGADMNLGFNTSASGSAANFTAFQWQSLINAGWKLPDLYAIHIGWASQGVDPADANTGTAAWTAHGWSLWQPLLTNSSMPSYALAPFSRRILNLALANILATGKKPRVITMQWNQWEADAVSATTITDAPTNYKNLFSGFTTAIGTQVPVQFIKPLSTAYGTTALSEMQTVFANLVSSNTTAYSELDVSKVSSTIYSGGVLGGGDGSVHYNLDTQLWFSQQAIGKCLTGDNCGTRLTSVAAGPTN